MGYPVTFDVIGTGVKDGFIVQPHKGAHASVLRVAEIAVQILPEGEIDTSIGFPDFPGDETPYAH